jgi:hypothetical protein
MRNLVFIAIFFIFVACTANSVSDTNEFKNYTITKVCDLPEEVIETSGILFLDGVLWTFNDSGNDPILYGIDTSAGEVVKSFEIAIAENIDWEAITEDHQNIYIADVGNNGNSRDTYEIYVLSKDSLTKQSTKKIHPSKVIRFEYSETGLEDINLNAVDVDCEAILSKEDSLVLLTKDWFYYSVAAFTFSKTTSHSTGELQGSFELGFAATAAVRMDENHLAILGYKDYRSYLVILDSDPTLRHAKEVARFELYDLEGFQTEGLCYADGKFYISSESLSMPQALFRMEFH